MARNSRSVHQFQALRVLDEFFGDTDEAERNRRYDAALERLADDDFDLMGPTVAGVEAAGKSARTPDPMRHLEAHWLSDDYWPSIAADRVRDTLREGYREAIGEARKLGLPLNSVWVCATDDAKSDTFRVDHVAGPNAVTVAIITPRPAMDV
jgi:hypothetical protein